MKTMYLSLLLTIISWHSTAQIKYGLSGEVPSNSTEWKIALRTSQNINPITVEDSKFSFTGLLDKPDMLMLTLDNEMRGIPLFITGGENISIKILEDASIEVSGNKDATDCYYKLSLPVLQWNAKVGELDEKLSTALKNKTADTAAIRKEYEKAVDGCFQVPQDFIKANPKSLVSIQALYYMDKGKDVGKPITLNDLERMYMSLSDAVRNSTYGKQYAADLAIWKNEL